MALLVGDQSPSTGGNLVGRAVSSPVPYRPKPSTTLNKSRQRSSGGGNAKTRRRSGGGGGQSDAASRRANRNRGGGGVSYNNKGQTTVKKAPAPPSLAQFLAKDTTYQGQLSDMGRALQQFLADIAQQKTTFQTGYSDTKSRLGQEHETGLEDIEADYAARGLLSSGLYGEAVGDYNETYAQQLSDLDKQLAQSLQGLTTQQTNYQSEYEAQKKKAEQEAAARRAAKYGV